MSDRISAQEAVRIATAAMSELYPAEHIQGLALEEVELAPNDEAWHVTLGFARADRKSAIEAMTGQEGARSYKVLCIDAADGTVASMKNRTL